MKNIFPELQIYAAPYPQEAAQIIDLFLSQPKKNLSRRMFTAVMPSASSHSIRIALQDLVDNEILTRNDTYYRLRIKPAVIAPMVPLRLSKVEIKILHQLDMHKEITARNVDVERTVFLKAARRLIERGLLETFERKHKSAVRRYYKFKRQEATTK
ncbi:hypothetical protein FR773_26175 (plasmid) [Leclercia adecarboxylata]|uniref:hypothetical protein n=1 Tax=Leclercia adecarboxylata TaxID=83655 RepID=UPI0012AA895D|nr:hypothetical protein [Leclercia adecarboxylata]QFH68118.1 hypothetical protein FR773_26175 [Leclercia adecarboxylata]